MNQRALWWAVAVVCAGSGGLRARAQGPSDALPGPAAAVAGSAAAVTGPSDAQLRAIAPGDWLTYNRDLSGDRYAPLDQINRGNVAQLSVKCVLQLGEQGSFESSPLVYQGRIYLTTVHKTVAVDGATCEPLWSQTYVPTDPEHLPGNRGLALYEGKLFRGTADAHLLAYEAATGKLLWNDRVASGAEGYEITGAPVAYEGRVFTGDAGADVGIIGRIRAFDADTGKSLWSFDIVPVDHEAGSQTWGGGNGNLHGGGASWSSMAIDPVHGLLLAPTGNPAPDFDGAARPGVNLYTDSVVALDMASGKLAWSVQQVPHDLHDWDTAAAPALYHSHGKDMMAVASKDGLLYLYDLSDGHALERTAQFNSRLNDNVPLSSTVPVHVCPGALGQYNGPAYSSELDMLFVDAADHCNMIEMRPPHYVPGQVYFGGFFRPDKQASGWVRGFAAGTAEQIWAYHDDAMTPSGVTVTKGGVVFAGDVNGWLMAFDAKSGQMLYRFMTGGPVAGGITAYQAGGQEYLAVASGSSSRDASSATAAATLVVFGLPARHDDTR